VNGNTIAYTNGLGRCAVKPNAYIALFPNFAERIPSSYYSGLRYQFCIDLFDSLKANPSGRVMPAEYFMFLETAWGGCGCYAQTDSKKVSVSGTMSAAIGFR